MNHERGTWTSGVDERRRESPIPAVWAIARRLGYDGLMVAREVGSGRGARRSWWRPALPAAMAAAVLGTVVAARALRSQDVDDSGLRGLRADRLAACLLGDGWDVAAEGSDARAVAAVRGSQLAVMGLSPDRRFAAPDLWPRRCVAPAFALAEDVKRRGTESEARTLAALAAALQSTDSATADWTPPLLAWLADVRASRRPFGHAADGPAPPRLPHPPLTIDTLSPHALLVRGTTPLSAVHFERTFDETATFILDAAALGDSAAAPPEPATSCVYAHGEARCAAVKGAAASAGALVSLGSAVVLAGDAGSGGVFAASTGEPVPVDGGVFGASVTDDGLDVVTTAPLPPEIRLVHLQEGGTGARRTETPLFTRAQTGDPAYNVALFWGFLVTKRVTPEAPGLRLRVRKVIGADVGPETDIGQVGEAAALEVPGRDPHLQPCRSQGVVAIRARGWDADYFSFYGTAASDGGADAAGPAWTAPVILVGGGGEMTCRGAEVALVDQRGHVEGHRYEPVVTESRCTPAACRTRSLQTRDLFANDLDVIPEELRDLHVAALGEALVVVWDGGDVGGLRMRVGKLDLLAKSDDLVVFDGHLEQGKLRPDSTLLDFALRPVSDGVLVLLATTGGTYLYRVVASDGEERAAPTLVPVPVLLADDASLHDAASQ